MRFFTLRVASNKEDRVREALQRKVKIEGLETHVGRILVPTERVKIHKAGVRRESDRKLRRARPLFTRCSAERHRLDRRYRSRGGPPSQ